MAVADALSPFGVAIDSLSLSPQAVRRLEAAGKENPPVIELRNAFSIPAPLDEAWQVLLDVERIAPCMPGAKVESVSGDEFEGSVKVKLGAMTLTYRGKAKIVEQDAAAHRAVIEGAAKEARGAGTAKAMVEAALHPEGGGTRVEVVTALHVTGRTAQFGRGVMAEVAERLIGQFSDRLREEMTASEEQSAAGAAPGAPEGRTQMPSPASAEPLVQGSAPGPSRAARDDGPIDLFAVAGAPVVKRVALAAAVASSGLVLRRLIAVRASARRRPFLGRGVTIVFSCRIRGRLS